MEYEDTFDASKVTTREGLLSALLEAALRDVESLTVTKERASLVMTDEAVSQNEALFAAKPEVGLREFVDAQDGASGKFAAFVATVGNPFLITCAAFEAFKGGYDELRSQLAQHAVCVYVEDRLEACLHAVLGVVGRNNATDLLLAGSAQEQKDIASRFLLSCIERAVELALTAKPGTARASATPAAIN